jgi:chromosome segregation ATPase
MVASKADARKPQAALDETNGARAEAEDKLGDAEAPQDEAGKELAETRGELAAILKKLEACQDECAELTTENRDVKVSNDRLDALNEELRDAVERLTDEKKPSKTRGGRSRTQSKTCSPRLGAGWRPRTRPSWTSDATLSGRAQPCPRGASSVE